MQEHISDTQPFVVRAYEIDVHRRATLPTLINYMQEAAWHNATARGGSVYLLHEHGVSWVLHRLRLEMFRYPMHLEQITVETWPSSPACCSCRARRATETGSPGSGGAPMSPRWTRQRIASPRSNGWTRRSARR